MHFRVGPLGRIDDLRRALIEDRVIVGLHANANDFLRLTRHGQLSSNGRVQTAMLYTCTPEPYSAHRSQRPQNCFAKLLSLPVHAMGKPQILRLLRNRVNGRLSRFSAALHSSHAGCANAAARYTKLSRISAGAGP